MACRGFIFPHVLTTVARILLFCLPCAPPNFVVFYRLTPFVNSLYISFIADECCEDRKLLLAMFREIKEETGVWLYEAEDGDGVAAEGATCALPELSLPSGKPGGYAWVPETVSLAVAQLANGCAGQGDVLGLDCEWEPSLGGATPNPVATVQLSLPDGTAFVFHLQRGNNRTSRSGFPKALKQLLENPSITKVCANFVVACVMTIFN